MAVVTHCYKRVTVNTTIVSRYPLGRINYYTLTCSFIFPGNEAKHSIKLRYSTRNALKNGRKYGTLGELLARYSKLMEKNHNH